MKFDDSKQNVQMRKEFFLNQLILFLRKEIEFKVEKLFKRILAVLERFGFDGENVPNLMDSTNTYLLFI
jgi:hypothetical protein